MGPGLSSQLEFGLPPPCTLPSGVQVPPRELLGSGLHFQPTSGAPGTGTNGGAGFPPASTGCPGFPEAFVPEEAGNPVVGPSTLISGLTFASLRYGRSLFHTEEIPTRFHCIRMDCQLPSHHDPTAFRSSTISLSFGRVIPLLAKLHYLNNMALFECGPRIGRALPLLIRSDLPTQLKCARCGGP